VRPSLRPVACASAASAARRRYTGTGCRRRHRLCSLRKPGPSG
jgi:hypothetical protein